MITMSNNSNNNLPPTFASVSAATVSNQRKFSNQLINANIPLPDTLTVNGVTPSGKPRTFVCTICTRAFARQEHLKRHERSHTKEKPFACSVCLRRFSRRDLLLRHATKLHAGSAELNQQKSRRKSVKRGSTTSVPDSRSNSNPNSPKSSNGKQNQNAKVSKTSRTPSISSYNRRDSLKVERHLNDKKKNKLTKNLKISASDEEYDEISNNDNNKNIDNDNDEDDDDDDNNNYYDENDEESENRNLGEENDTMQGVQNNDPHTFKKKNNNNNRDSFDAKKQQKRRKSKPFNKLLERDDSINNNNSNFINNFNNFTSNTNIHHLLRRASFSAMSGANYAMPTAEPYASETVEFSTPQMVGIDDSENWLNNLGPIPSLDFMNPDFSLNRNDINPTPSNHSNINNNIFNQSQNKIFNRNFVQEDMIAPEDPISKNQDITGYSFYDVPSRNVESLFTHTKFQTNDDNNDNNNNNDNNYNGHLGSVDDSNYPSPYRTTNKKHNFRYIQLQDSPDTESSNGSAISPDNNYNTNGSNNIQSTNNTSTVGYNKALSERIDRTLSQNIDDELEEITDLNGAKSYKISQGYSFYGTGNNMMNFFEGGSSTTNTTQQTPYNNNISNIPQLPSSSGSSNATISPILLDNSASNPGSNGFPASRQQTPLHSIRINSNSYVNNNSISGIDESLNNLTLPKSMLQQQQLQNQSHHQQYSADQQSQYHSHSHSQRQQMQDKFEKYSKTQLFTPTIRHYVYQSLTKYPFIGVPNPSVPDNDKLNSYIDEFKTKFLNHHPFIHESVLNEYSLIKMILSTLNIHPLASNDENTTDNTKVSLVCLPLLIATIGAVVSNKKSDASNLYEASRRCIHVYLDSRKKIASVVNTKLKENGGEGDGKEINNNSSSPLWLIQSLTLSVVYGLFADNEISLNIIIRQVNALNSLIKSSGLNSLSWTYNPEIDVVNQTYFDNFIKYESTIRSIHMVFHISSLLSSLYNIVPSLKVDDLYIQLPVDSKLWECDSLTDFKLLLLKNYKSTNSSMENSLLFTSILTNLLNYDFDELRRQNDCGRINGVNFFDQRNVSEFGLICLQNGLHQFNYFQQLSRINNTNNSNTNINNFNSFNPVDAENTIKLNDIKLNNVVKNWDFMVSGYSKPDKDEIMMIDSKLLNDFLFLKTSPLMNFNKIKENVWLKNWSDVCDLYHTNFNITEEDFDSNERFNIELIGIIEKSIDLVKVLFFKPINDEDYYNTNNYFNLSQTQINQLKEISDPELGQLDINSFTSKLSINIQVLYDILLNLVKFVINYERAFKKKIQFGHSNISFVQHFELHSTILNTKLKRPNKSSSAETLEETNGADDYMETYKARMFKNYKLIFKIYLNLEMFLKINYGYHDFESEFSSLTISNLVNNHKNFRSNLFSNSQMDFSPTSTDAITTQLGSESASIQSPGDLLTKVRDRDLMLRDLISLNLPFKLLKIGEFLFSFLYDRNLKFVIFQNLSNSLFHLRVYLENKEEYMD